MPVEQGQLRVWDDAMSLDKTPFLVLDKVDDGLSPENDWRIIWGGQVRAWNEGQLNRFSEVIDESR